MAIRQEIFNRRAVDGLETEILADPGRQVGAVMKRVAHQGTWQERPENVEPNEAE